MAVGVLFLLLAWTAIAMLTVRDDLEDARSELTSVTDGGDDVEATRARLRDAATGLRRAEGRLSAPGPLVVSRLPLIGRTPRAALVTSRAALAAVEAGRRVLDVTTDGPPLVADGRLDAAALGDVATTLRRAAGDLRAPVRDLRALKTGLTPSVISNGVYDAREQLDGLPASLAEAGDALEALAQITGRDGPQRLLIVLENNAELRGTGGLVSVFAEATATDGRLQVDRFRDVEDVAERAERARRVPSPPDYQGLWGRYLADTTLWKNTNMSPDIPTSSAVLAEVARASLGRKPDAIVWLDVPAVAEIIGATSPARLPDGTVLTEESTVSALLSEAYLDVGDNPKDQAVRRARLRAAADSVTDRLLRGSPDASRLSVALASAARGRHLALWSADEGRQQALRAAGLAGEVAADNGDLMSAVVQNFGGGDRQGNKLDFYARRSVKVDVRLTRTTAEVTQELVLRNTAPNAGLPAYVAGGATPGVSNNFLTFAVPERAKVLAFTRGGQPVSTATAPERDHRVLTDAVSLPAGTSVTWQVRYSLPLEDATYDLHLVPQPLAFDADLDVRVRPARGTVLRDDHGRPGEVRLTGAFEDRETVSVRVERPSWPRRVVDRVKRFWNEPVPSPF